MSVLTRLPKPVQFGLWGAIGGLLGAILLGEPIWRLLEPPPPPPPAAPLPRLAVSASPSVALYADGKNTFTLQFESDRLNGAPVQVQFTGAPHGLTIAPTTGTDKGEREVAVSASEFLEPDSFTVTVTATAKVGNDTVSAETSLNVRIEPTPMPIVDVMFALDTTGSMGWAINGVSTGIQNFVDELAKKKKMDVRFGLVAFKHYIDGANQLRVIIVNKEPFTTDVIGFRNEVRQLRAGGGGDNESSLDGVAEAAKQPFRPKATKVILLITDEPPIIPDKRIKTVKDAVGELKLAKIDQLHLVVRPEHRTTFEGLRDAAPGEYFDLSRVVQGDAFAKLLPELSKVIASAAEAARPNQRPELAAPPPSVALPEVRSLQSSQAYDPSAKGQLFLAFSGWTAAIAGLISMALAAGQFLSLGRFPRPLPVAAGLAGGLAAGLIGGIVGQTLYLLAPESTAIRLIFQIIGWMALGALAGVGLAFVVPNLRKSHGLLGGAVGGGLGAVGYILVSSIGLGDVLGRAAGATILGLCIGLMVALVEAAFRRAWLEVRFGGGEVIRVNLGPEPVKIGSDSKQCVVWARGAVPVALRYWVRDNQVILHDTMMRVEWPVRNGDTRQAGAVMVTVHTSSSEAPAVSQPVRTPPPVPSPVARPVAVAVPPPPAPPKAMPAAPMVAKPAAPVAATPVATLPKLVCPECGAAIEKKPGVCGECGAMV